MSRQWPADPPKRRSPMDSGNNKSDKWCCYGGAAIGALRRGRYRLAARYARLSARRIVGWA
jgi:hypothetical protein